MYQIIKDRKIKIAVVGCGRISNIHVKTIRGLSKNFELVAVCDINKSNSLPPDLKTGLKFYSDLEVMLQSEELDVISLCTPSGIHSRQAMQAARHGVNVITEKPMATRLQDGIQMVNACDQAGVRLFVIKQNRNNPTLRLLKRALVDKRFGKIHMVNVNVFWTRPQEYYDSGSGWRGTWEFDGGALMNQSSHYVDLLEWLIGPVEKVHAMMSTTRDIETEDTGVLNLKWRNGALGSMSVTMLTFPKNLEGSITILGENGTAKVGGVAVNKINTWEFSDVRDYDQEVLNADYVLETVYGHGHHAYYEQVIDVLRGNCEPDTDGREGLKSLELLIAAYISARDNKQVGLPLTY